MNMYIHAYINDYIYIHIFMIMHIYARAGAPRLTEEEVQKILVLREQVRIIKCCGLTRYIYIYIYR